MAPFHSFDTRNEAKVKCVTKLLPFAKNLEINKTERFAESSGKWLELL